MNHQACIKHLASNINQLILFSHSDPKAQPWGGPKADISEAFGPTGNGGAGAEPPLTIIENKRLVSDIYVYM